MKTQSQCGQEHVKAHGLVHGRCCFFLLEELGFPPAPSRFSTCLIGNEAPWHRLDGVAIP